VRDPSDGIKPHLETDPASGSWTFGGAIAAGFDEHARASIPWYDACHQLIADLADHLVPAGGRCYELGCSTGTLTELLAARLEARGAHVVGIDAEPDMIERARERCAARSNAAFQTARVEEATLEPADLAVSFYTLHFVPRRDRAATVARIRAALEPAGSLILFEKTLAPNAREQEIATAVYHDWKRRQGLSDREIAAKARSLRGVLDPQSEDENRSMLRAAGFAEPASIFRWLVWVGILTHASGA
jgi:tRNA (cmo5U34)-methyltransferase